jgi:hypothetical protein
MVENIPKYIYDNVDRICPDPKLNIPNEYKHLIWFVTPGQVIRQIEHEFEQNQLHKQFKPPFDPR